MSQAPFRQVLPAALCALAFGAAATPVHKCVGKGSAAFQRDPARPYTCMFMISV